MTYTNQSIKVKITRESYALIGSITRCRLKIKLMLTPVISYEYDVTGWSNCHKDDIYDESTGKKIAMARAVSKAYKEAYRYASIYIRRQMMFIDAFNRFQHKVSDVVYGNLNYIERFRNDTKDNKEPEGQKE